MPGEGHVLREGARASWGSSPGSRVLGWGQGLVALRGALGGNMRPSGSGLPTHLLHRWDCSPGK